MVYLGIPVVHTDRFFWEGLAVTIYFGGKPEAELSQKFKNLVNSWYVLGMYGTFEGRLHSISEVWNEGSEAGFNVDMGSASKSALEILLYAIECFAEVNDLVIEKFILGMEIQE